MLPPYIIEQIRRREDDKRHQPMQPVVELPVPHEVPLGPTSERTDEDDQHGVVIIDL